MKEIIRYQGLAGAPERILGQTRATTSFPLKNLQLSLLGIPIPSSLLWGNLRWLAPKSADCLPPASRTSVSPTKACGSPSTAVPVFPQTVKQLALSGHPPFSPRPLHGLFAPSVGLRAKAPHAHLQNLPFRGLSMVVSQTSLRKGLPAPLQEDWNKWPHSPRRTAG